MELRYGDEVVRIARENLILSEDSLADLASAEANRHFDDAETWFSRHYDRDARTEILRGLKLQPESIDGLKLLGRTYKLNRMYDHYTDLLQRLTEMYPEDSDLKDEWEIYDNRAQSRTAAEWKIDPLSVVRNRFPLALYIRRTPAAEQLFHYGLDEHLLRYYESFLTSDTDFFEIPDSAVVGWRALFCGDRIAGRSLQNYKDGELPLCKKRGSVVFLFDRNQTCQRFGDSV